MANLVLLSGKEPLTSTQMAIALRVAPKKMEIGIFSQVQPELITAAIVECAKNYCGYVKQNDSVFIECLNFVETHFSKLDYREINVAFSMAAANIFDCDLSAYNGVFTVNILGKVLAGYNAHAQKITKEWRDNNKVEEVKPKSEIDRLNEAALEDMKSFFDRTKEKVKQGLELSEWDVIGMQNFCRDLVACGYILASKEDKYSIALKAWEHTKMHFESLCRSNYKHERNLAREALMSINQSKPNSNANMFQVKEYAYLLFLHAINK